MGKRQFLYRFCVLFQKLYQLSLSAGFFIVKKRPRNDTNDTIDKLV